MAWAAVTLTLFLIFFPKTVGRHFAEITIAYRDALARQKEGGEDG
jgi:hypothetical protein